MRKKFEIERNEAYVSLIRVPPQKKFPPPGLDVEIDTKNGYANG